MEKFRFKIVRTDGSHYFYTEESGTKYDSLLSGRGIASHEGVSKVELYWDSKLIATFYH